MSTPIALTGRVAVVTGASRGIGRAIAGALVAEGATVVMIARSQAGLDAAAREIGVAARPLVCDVGDAASVARAVGIIRADHGAPHILVNNAGLFLLQPAIETSVDDFAKMVEVNLVSPFRFIRAFLADLVARRDGHIVTIGSIADRTTFPGNAGYASAKHGLRALHEVLRSELRDTGVRATLVSPSPVDTPLWDPVDPDNRPGFTPRSQMLSPSAVADAVRYAVTRPLGTNIDELRLSRG